MTVCNDPHLYSPLWLRATGRDTIRDKIPGSPHQIVPERHNAEVKVSKTELIYYSGFFSICSLFASL